MLQYGCWYKNKIGDQEPIQIGYLRSLHTANVTCDPNAEFVEVSVSLPFLSRDNYRCRFENVLNDSSERYSDIFALKFHSEYMNEI